MSKFIQFLALTSALKHSETPYTLLFAFKNMFNMDLVTTKLVFGVSDYLRQMNLLSYISSVFQIEKLEVHVFYVCREQQKF